jgi:hypothetical protein
MALAGLVQNVHHADGAACPYIKNKKINGCRSSKNSYVMVGYTHIKFVNISEKVLENMLI